MPKQTAKTFKEMRRLPLEVSFQQVEAWVKKAPPTTGQVANRWLPLFIARFLYKRSSN